MTCSAEIPDSSSSVHHFIGFESGIHYNYSFGPKHFPPSSQQTALFWSSYSLKFSFAPHFGFIYRLQWKKLILDAGISYFERKSNKESPKDTVIKYTPPEYLSVVFTSHKVTYHNLELPIYIGLALKRFSISTGIRFEFMTFYSSKQTYINDSISSRTWLFREKQSFSQRSFIGIRADYNFYSGKIPITVYTGADYALLRKFLYFQLGLKIYLYKK